MGSARRSKMFYLTVLFLFDCNCCTDPIQHTPDLIGGRLLAWMKWIDADCEEMINCKIK